MNRFYQQYMYSYPHKTAYRELNNITFADVKSRIYEHKTLSIFICLLPEPLRVL